MTLTSWAQSRAEDALIHVLSAGPIPRHIAFVMDGNRRYARKNQKQVQQGHQDGYSALRRLLEICLRLKIQCVSVYAFSIENFNRSQEEVDALMGLAEEKLLELCSHGDLLDKYGVRLHVLGRRELLPPEVQRAAQKAEDQTRTNDRAILNICMPYTSRDEITTAVQSAVREALETAQSSSSSELEGMPYITESTIESHLMTSSSPPLDILVRTSGVRRLSDFLLWQCCENTQIHFIETYWPDFGFWDFIPILLDYQRKAWTPKPETKR